MKRLFIILGLSVASYQGGAALGYSLGVKNGRAVCDLEWARMLENGMVGPGTIHRPGTTAALAGLMLTGGN